jgi:myo-inositol-1(or 4)-monophosphatase
MKDFTKVAVDSALKAGQLLKEKLGSVQEIRHKGTIDLVTKADIESERLLVSIIRRNFPDHDLLAEEGSQKRNHSNYLWLIDPLDGTTNFAHGIPVFAVSIALEFKKELILGVVYNPASDELFSAEKGQGAFLNNKRITVSKIDKLNNSVLATGFPYYIREKPGLIFDYYKNFRLAAQGIRRCGSAALDLCYVACERFDGFWEEGLKPWDMAAGSLIVKEAGGTLSQFDGSPFDIYTPEIVANNSKIHQEMLDIIRRTKEN